MSFRLVNDVAALKAKPLEKLVLVMLAKRVNDDRGDNTAYPSLNKLASDTGISKRHLPLSQPKRPAKSESDRVLTVKEYKNGNTEVYLGKTDVTGAFFGTPFETMPDLTEDEIENFVIEHMNQGPFNVKQSIDALHKLGALRPTAKGWKGNPDWA
jgi:hypothetical protein